MDENINVSKGKHQITRIEFAGFYHFMKNRVDEKPIELFTSPCLLQEFTSI